MWILGLKGLTTGELCSGLSQEPITGGEQLPRNHDMEYSQTSLL